MHTLADGMPAWRLVRAPEWQYRHGIAFVAGVDLVRERDGCSGA